jgi:hypothetical protein
MSNKTVLVTVTNPADGRSHDAKVSLNYDIVIRSATHSRVDIDFSSKHKEDADGACASVKMTTAVARWLGLALLRVSLRNEQDQRLEVRADRFPNDRMS